MRPRPLEAVAGVRTQLGLLVLRVLVAVWWVAPVVLPDGAARGTAARERHHRVLVFAVVAPLEGLVHVDLVQQALVFGHVAVALRAVEWPLKGVREAAA